MLRKYQGRINKVRGERVNVIGDTRSTTAYGQTPLFLHIIIPTSGNGVIDRRGFRFLVTELHNR
jgi:hypothetical protein